MATNTGTGAISFSIDSLLQLEDLACRTLFHQSTLGNNQRRQEMCLYLGSLKGGGKDGRREDTEDHVFGMVYGWNRVPDAPRCCPPATTGEGLTLAG